MPNATPASFQIRRAIILFFCCLFLILCRVWWLSVHQREKYLQEALKPQRKLVIDPVERAPIYDRFGIPLALNKPQYQAAISYAEIQNIPRFKWEKDSKGKTYKIPSRLLYLESLSQFLGQALGMDPTDIEDLILGEAALFPHTPLVLKENLSEELYAKLKLEEKDWPGLKAQRVVKRVYPQGKVGCHVLGYIGAMGESQYRHIREELSSLKNYIKQEKEGKTAILPEGFDSPSAVEKRITELEHLSYSMNDEVGKSGIEAYYDKRLKGTKGKKIYEVDVKGHLLSEIETIQTKQIPPPLFLSLSTELQLEAEQLLLEYEKLQDKLDENAAFSPHRFGEKAAKRHHTWVRGGAIVALDPKTGEVLALASTPRFDPNDFVPSKKSGALGQKERKKKLDQWLENETYLGDIWDGKRPLEREIFSTETGQILIETKTLTWENYLASVLSPASAVYNTLIHIETIEEVFRLQKEFSPLHPALKEISSLQDKFLAYDLLHLLAPEENFSLDLAERLCALSPSTFFYFSQLVNETLSVLEEELKSLYHKTLFKQWREAHFKEFIKTKRKEEKEHNRYAKPYTDYLKEQEKNLFNAFWQTYRYPLLFAFITKTPEENIPLLSPLFLRLASHSLVSKLRPLEEFLSSLAPSLALSYLESIRSFSQLTTPLKGRYSHLKKEKGIQLEKHLAMAFYPPHGWGFIRSEAFSTSSPMGSIFKIIPPYAVLHAQEEKQTPLSNPLTLTDNLSWTTKQGSFRQVLGYFEGGEPIYRLHKGGILPRGYPNMGKLDLYKAIERSSNLYFSILAGDVLENPSSLLDACYAFGLGSLTGIDLPGEYEGFVPIDILHNKTSLYSFAIGQHALIATPLQAARMFSALANQGILVTPHLASSPCNSPLHPFVPMSKELHQMLLKGMFLVLNGERGSARPASFANTPHHNKKGLSALRSLGPYLCGKTGTAEILHKETLDIETLANMEKHTWFACLSFEDKEHTVPDIVVVVYLRFGYAGRQGAPFAARIVEKWKEIVKKQTTNNTQHRK